MNQAVRFLLLPVVATILFSYSAPVVGQQTHQLSHEEVRALDHQNPVWRQQRMCFVQDAFLLTRWITMATPSSAEETRSPC